MSDIKDWLELANKVYLQDSVKAEVLFVHGWGDLAKEMVEYVVKIFKSSEAEYIVINGAEEYEIGKPGVKYWKDELMNKYKIPEESIFDIGRAKHTYAEGIGFIKFAKEKEIKSAIIITVPQHVIRAFLTDLGITKAENSDLRLIPRTLPKVDWSESIHIRSINGTDEKTTRLGRLAGEFARIIEYRERAEAGEPNYSIASVKEGLGYLNNLPTYD